MLGEFTLIYIIVSSLFLFLLYLDSFGKGEPPGILKFLYLVISGFGFFIILKTFNWIF